MHFLCITISPNGSVVASSLTFRWVLVNLALAYQGISGGLKHCMTPQYACAAHIVVFVTLVERWVCDEIMLAARQAAAGCLRLHWCAEWREF